MLVEVNYLQETRTLLMWCTQEIPLNFLQETYVNDESYQLRFERKLIRHCAPTLAALKCANLFTCRDESTPNIRGNNTPLINADDYEQEFSKALRTYRAKLASCGVRLEVLARRKTGVLVYAYRPTLLSAYIQQPTVAAYLTNEGYDVSSLSSCIQKLHQRICGTDIKSHVTGQCSFPHEIGLFLGYPLDDVIGFIENKGENFLCSGCWKVYSKERDAQTCFCCYKNCTTMYECLFDEGVPIECLAAVDENFPANEAFQQAG